MKKLLFFLLFPLLAIGQTVTVTPGQNVAQIVQAQKAGAVVKFTEGVFTYEDIAVPVGVSLQGSGVEKTVLKPARFTWWKASILLHSSTTTPGNQSISDMTLDAAPQNAFQGIGIHNRTDVKIFNIKINRYHSSAICVMGGGGGKSANIEIYNFLITESSRESTAGSYGSIMVDGSIDNLYVHDGEIQALTNDVLDNVGTTPILLLIVDPSVSSSITERNKLSSPA